MPLPSIFRRWLASLALLLALPAAAADVELPPVDDVFVLSAQATARDRAVERLDRVGRLDGGQRVAGVDRTNEGVGGFDGGDFGDLPDVE